MQPSGTQSTDDSVPQLINIIPEQENIPVWYDSYELCKSHVHCSHIWPSELDPDALCVLGCGTEYREFSE